MVYFSKIDSIFIFSFGPISLLIFIELYKPSPVPLEFFPFVLNVLNGFYS